MTDWVFADHELRRDDVVALLELHAREMTEWSPPGATHFLDLDALDTPSITFLTLRLDGALAGCGALRELDLRHGELKSMRTDPAHLGKGVGRRMLSELVDRARTRGYAQVSLETGAAPQFDAALHLYSSFGFEPCGPFADYVDGPFSRFFTLRL